MPQEFKHIEMLKTEKVSEAKFPKEIRSKIAGFNLQLAKFKKGDEQAEHTAAKISDTIADMLTTWRTTEEYADLLDGGAKKKAEEEARVNALAEKKAADKLAAEKAAKEKQDAEASAKAAAEKAEADRIAAETEATAKAEADRLAAEKAEADKIEAERLAAEAAAKKKAKDDNAALDILTGRFYE